MLRKICFSLFVIGAVFTAGSVAAFAQFAQLNGTAWLIMPDATATALKIPGNCTASNLNVASLCGQPATQGDYLVLYVTGLGKATPSADPNGKELKTGDSPPADGSGCGKYRRQPR